MHDIYRNPSSDWNESSNAKAWARNEQPYEPIPSFGSSVRTRLQQSIADDEAEIIRLEDSIREIQHRISRNRARLAPIRLIPNETLSAIFIDWQHVRDRPRSVPRGYFAPPSTIMKICLRWTACAISTPAIWTHGKYRIDASTITSGDRAWIFKRYIERSGSRNLAVEFVGSWTMEGYKALTHDIWRHIVQPSLSRVEDLKLYGKDRYRDHQSLVISLAICTRLTQLKLGEIDFPESPGGTHIVLPGVRKVEYYSCNGHLPIEYPGLVECDIQESSLSYSYGHLLSITSPLLQKAYLCLNKMPRGQFLSRPTFPSLKHLTFDHHRDMSVPEWFFGCPNVCRLELELAEESFASVSQTLSLSKFSSLAFLTLTMMVALEDFEIRIMHEWMVQANNLVEFQLTFDDVGDPDVLEDTGMGVYIEPLLATKRNPPCFPYLKRIIMPVEIEPELEAALLQLLLDRAPDAERLEAGYPSCGMSSRIVQKPCRLTQVKRFTPPDTTSIGLTEFLEIRRRQSLRTSMQQQDDDEEEWGEEVI